MRQDIDRLAAAQYFAQLSYELAAEEQPAPELLCACCWNTLHLLCKVAKPLVQIKAVFELRALSISGYMPNILACANCGTYETPVMYFDVDGAAFTVRIAPRQAAVAVPRR